MRILFTLLCLMFGGVILACDINADMPRTESSKKAFIQIGRDFANCIKSSKSKKINFVNYKHYNRMRNDKRFLRETAVITWDRKSPTKKDKLRAGANRNLNGVSYHNLKKGTSLIRCKEPVTDKEFETLGHEVLHSFLGAFHT